MVILPLVKRLRKHMHRNIIYAQDLAIIELYNLFPNVVIHGGTAILRCFSSNRFSEDVDVYLPPRIKESDLKEFLQVLQRRGFIIKKFKHTRNSVFSKFLYGKVEIRFEAVFKKVKSVVKPFELSDGTTILVNALPVEELVREKVDTYLGRRKIRDLYDIFFLLRFVENKHLVAGDLKRLTQKFKPPLDEMELKVLIISGSVPTTEAMLNEVKKWAR